MPQPLSPAEIERAEILTLGERAPSPPPAPRAVEAAPAKPRLACETCAYWQPPAWRQTLTDAAGKPVTLGQCRRYPPSIERTDKGPRALFPLTPATMWCGEHGVE